MNQINAQQEDQLNELPNKSAPLDDWEESDELKMLLSNIDAAFQEMTVNEEREKSASSNLVASVALLATHGEAEPRHRPEQASSAIAAKVIEKAMTVLKLESAIVAETTSIEVESAKPPFAASPTATTEAESITPSTHAIAAVAEAMTNYSFPADDTEDDLSASDEVLRSRLEDLVGKVKLAEDYLAVRDEYCSNGVILNFRGRWAPAFRCTVSIPFKKDKRDAAHMLIHRDHLVIDFHWLHTKQHNVSPSEPKWRTLFNLKGPFSFQLAEEFATTVLKSDYRASAILGLTERLQLQTRSLRGNTVIDRVREIGKYDPTKSGKRVRSELELLRLEINRWSEDDPRIDREKEKYFAHAQARLLLSYSGPPSHKAVAELGGLIQGVAALKERTVCDLMSKLDTRVAKSAARSKSA